MACQQNPSADTMHREAKLLRYLAMNAHSPAELERLIQRARTLDAEAKALQQPQALQ
jgi:hypothetical protein